MTKSTNNFSSKRQKIKSKKFLFWLIPVIAGAAFVAAIVITGLIFSGKFFANTYAGETKIGGMTVDEANAALHEASALTIVTKDGTSETVPFDTIDYFCDYTGGLTELADSQPTFLALFNIAGKKEYQIATQSTYNEEKLDTALKNLSCISGDGVAAPVDAHIEYSDGEYKIIDAVDGNRINYDKFKELVTTSLNNARYSINLNDSADVYDTASVRASDPSLISLLDKIKSLGNTTITLDLTDAEESVGPTVYQSWIGSSGTELTIDKNSAVDYLSSLAKKYNTYGTDRKFPATGIGMITVPSAGSRDTYGFKMDVNATADKLIEAIKGAESKTITPVWSVPARTRNAANGSGDIGNTYIEIDVSRQHMWYYVDGNLFIETDVRTGEESAKRYAPTPSGIFRILSKQTDKAFLEFYPVSYADYWMPFDWQGCGIHDASWYSTFGGDLYKSASGSHGCINTPLAAVSTIYNNITTGTPVIVYRSAG